MQRIRDLLVRDLDQTIEEIVKLDQIDEQSVYTELVEYVVTGRISAQYRTLLQAIADAPADPTEGIGVWVSGFFGSGKSSFAKLLGYVLANRRVLGVQAAELFKQHFGDQRVPALVDSINARIPTEAIMFDVSVDRAMRDPNQRIAEIIYTVLLRELGYAEDFVVAELEIELEAEGKLAEFEERCQEQFGMPWRTVRKGALKHARASAILHAMDPATFPAADSWSNSASSRNTQITVARLVDRTFELMVRRRPGMALVFIIDEVGQYVAHNADKIEDLRVVVEQFGKESKNRVKAHRAIAPVWIVVTSQEKLDEVVEAIDSKRIELAKLQDRFKHHVDMAPADIREVATRRVLAKRVEAQAALRELFARNQGQLNAACRLERTSRRCEVRADEFVDFYPYLPHLIELSIDIVSGIRLQPGAARHLGGSNRTIIKQAYEMLANERTALGEKPVGSLVTLDLIYELVEGNLSSEKQRDISDVSARFADDASDGGWAARVAKAICLLEFVRDLPRTPANLAALLVDEVGEPAPVPQVSAALQRLVDAQFVRETEEGYKLQTAQEKNWDVERRGYLAPRPRERNEIRRAALAEVFDEQKLKVHRHADLRSFTVGLSVDGVSLGDPGQLPLQLVTADDDADFPAKLATARDESRQSSHQCDLYWVYALTPEIDDLISEVFASGKMIEKYGQLRGQNRITGEESASLNGEEQSVRRRRGHLRDKLGLALLAGTGVFRGVTRDGSVLGKNLGEVFRSFFDGAIPDLYPKLSLGARPLKGSEAEEVLKAANLNALPTVFYDGENGLGLVVKDGTRYVPNPSAEVAREVNDYLVREHSYGNKLTGKALEDHFGGIGYGWERDLIRLVLAVLLRAGTIEVTYQGRRYRGYQDPQSRVPLTSNAAFRNASFAPHQSLGMKTLTSAAQQYEALTGEEIDVEVGAIAGALKKLADQELKLLLPLEAVARANALPVLEAVEAFKTSLQQIEDNDPEDCVQVLAGEGTSLRAERDRIHQMERTLDDAGVAIVRSARQAHGQIWPVLRDDSATSDLSPVAEELGRKLGSAEFYTELPEIGRLTEKLGDAYRDRYQKAHAERASAFQAAIDDLKGQRSWGDLAADAQQNVLGALTSRACATLSLNQGSLACDHCRATLSQMASDLVALPGLKTQALQRMQELLAPSERVERVRLAEFFATAPSSNEAIDAAIDQLRVHLHKLVVEKVRIVFQ